jgi:hypothetical protein
MADALDLLENLDFLNVSNVVIGIMEANENVMAELNREQLREGLNSEGGLIGDYKAYRNAVYAFEKYRMNPAPGLGNPDLNLTGDHYNAMYAKVQGRNYEQGSTDEKSRDLERKYNDGKASIYGLNDESREELVEKHLQPQWVAEIEKETGLRFT